MSEPKVTHDGRPIAGWIVKANPDTFDVEGALAEYGVVTS